MKITYISNEVNYGRAAIFVSDKKEKWHLLLVPASEAEGLNVGDTVTVKFSVRITEPDHIAR